MIGYFRFGSKSNGLYITPYRSVTPSSALTVNGSGNLKPASISALRSGVSSFITSVAERVVERRFRRAVRRATSCRRSTCVESDTDDRVRRVARIEQLEAGAVEADAIEVGVVRILALLAAGGGDVHRRAVLSSTLSMPVVTYSPSVIRFFSAPVLASYR